MGSGENVASVGVDIQGSLAVEPPGWTAELDLGFGLRGERTELVRRRHHGPLVVQRPFYPEGSTCHVYLVHPPGGVVGGDRITFRAYGEPGTQVLLTTPAASKFYRSAGPVSSQTAEITLRSSQLEWLPQETIYYPGAKVISQTRIRLDSRSAFLGWEICCLGLPARDAPYTSGHIAQDFEVWCDEKPLLLDRLRLNGDRWELACRWGLAAHNTFGTFLAYPVARELRRALQADLDVEPSEVFGLSWVDGVLMGRCIASKADSVRRRFVSLWEQLRPTILERPAVAPRIWAT